MANYVPSTPTDVGAEPAGSVSAHNSSGTAHADLRPVMFAPATMTVNAGTLNAGTVADLAEVGGTDVSIQELTGANPLTVTFGFAGVTRLSNVHLYLDYIGGASHVIACEMYNNVTAGWDTLGTFSTTTGKVWRSFEVFTPNSYINAGAVSMRLRHLGTGINTHQLIIDYVNVNAGGGGGIGYIGAASVNFVPAGNIAATNVQTAIVELDTEKQPALTATSDIDIRTATTVNKTIVDTTLDFSNASCIVRAISGASAVAFGAPTLKDGQRVDIVLQYAAGATAEVTFTGVRWIGAVPTFTAEKTTWVTLKRQGSDIYGFAGVEV